MTFDNTEYPKRRNGRDRHTMCCRLVRKPENTYYDGEYQLPERNESPDLSALVIERVYRDD
ncbi:MAG: hypothetical protein EA383_00810 [Spirochaetaceae bacterium]|nr:MAG: hypothetical protein EA383_00810 [Spirochaetaceae bacterium]